jgi:cell division septum initiation protein DivIVA
MADPSRDVNAKLDELAALVEGARAMPMSASCVVNRAEVLGYIEAIRGMLPAALDDAGRIIGEREAVIAEGQAEAARIIDTARAERTRLINRTEVMRDAAREAERVIGEANAESERMRLEIDDYVDGKLANFEVVLHKTLKAVEKGRAKISGRHELESLAEPAVDEPVLPE